VQTARKIQRAKTDYTKLMPTREQYGKKKKQSQQKEIKAPDTINSQNRNKLPPSRNRLSGIH